MTGRQFLSGVAYLGAALVLAGALVYFPRGSSDPVAVAHRGDKVAATAMVAAGLVSPVILVGVAVTALFLWSRHPVLRNAYLVVMFVVLVGDLTLLMADGWKDGLLTCWDCEGPFLLVRGIIPGSLFMLIVPVVWLWQSWRSA